ncbi:alpha/beta hydrolase [Candidatus Poribacteria bacterium]|nr:alpha/beta hydrolase [Candidatus Poribacteria bacterium]
MVRKLRIILGVCIAVFVAAAVFAVLFMRPISDATLKELGVIEPDSRFVSVDEVPTRYIEEGAGGETIVFIHGFSSSLYTWRQCIGPIAAKHHVVALDLKGFGFSGKPPSEYTIDGYVDFLIHFMDATGVRTATLCGNSMGGNIAWRAALKYPERVDKLILVDASGYEEKHPGIPLFLKLGRLPGVGELLSAFMTRGRVRSVLESAYYDPVHVTERTVSAYYYSMKTEGAMRAVLARLRRKGSDAAQWQGRIPEIKAPTLIIWGENDKWIEKENAIRFHKDIRGSMLVIIPECGHVPQEEKPAELVSAVLEFMSGQTEKDILTIEKSLPVEPMAPAGTTV